jgi:hypothetical protein
MSSGNTGTSHADQWGTCNLILQAAAFIWPEFDREQSLRCVTSLAAVNKVMVYTAVVVSSSTSARLPLTGFHKGYTRAKALERLLDELERRVGDKMTG